MTGQIDTRNGRRHCGTTQSLRFGQALSAYCWADELTNESITQTSQDIDVASSSASAYIVLTNQYVIMTLHWFDLYPGDPHRPVLTERYDSGIQDSPGRASGCSMRSESSLVTYIRRLPCVLIVAILGTQVQAAANDGGSPGVWQTHKYDFHFMGVTSTYSCDGLGDKLQLLLLRTGARADLHVAPLCARGFGVPDKLAQATISFWSLQPVAGATSNNSGSTVAGAWRHVELATNSPRELRDGDCELMEQFRDSVLPMFATRDVQTRGQCIPNQASGFFSLQFDVFAPAAGDKIH